MDNKMSGLTMEIVKDTFEKSKIARLKVLEVMEKAITKPKGELSKFAPKVVRAEIPVDKIGELIGPGGKNIRELTERTGAEIAVEENGAVNIYAMDQKSIDMALDYVKKLGLVPVVGEIYDGKVVTIMEYGAFVDIAPGISGLVHVSEITDEFVKDVRKYLKEGDEVKVKLVSKERDGKLKLSIKQVNAPKQEKTE
jgi:polyribonucleotide nucleotidyltransferase